jgi:serine/threonine protein kinase
VNNDWHKYNKIYRDLNLTNISLINGSNNDFDIELREEGVGPQTPSSDKREDQRYFSPQVLTREEYDIKADIYSLGKIMIKLFSIDLRKYSKTFYFNNYFNYQ